MVPGLHVWPPGCCIHPIQYFKNVAPLLLNPGDGPAQRTPIETSTPRMLCWRSGTSIKIGPCSICDVTLTSVGRFLNKYQFARGFAEILILAPCIFHFDTTTLENTTALENILAPCIFHFDTTALENTYALNI